ncbi:MAG: hypothetical protein Q8M83_04045 [bacterium]|nr:hypothetical protein [bacterium]
MKKMGMGLFVLFIFSGAVWAQDNQSVKDHAELERLSGLSLQALALGDVETLQKMMEKEAIVGIPCSGKAIVIETSTEWFQKMVVNLQPASQQAFKRFQLSQAIISFSDADDYRPFKRGDVVVIGRKCAWGLLFRPRADSHQYALKGFFLKPVKDKKAALAKDKEITPSKQPRKQPPKIEQKKKKNKKRQDPSEWRIFF